MMSGAEGRERGVYVKSRGTTVTLGRSWRRRGWAPSFLLTQCREGEVSYGTYSTRFLLHDYVLPAGESGGCLLR